MLRVFTVLSVLILSFSVTANDNVSDRAEVSPELHEAMVKAIDQQLPGLGMRVLAVEDGQHVLAGGNGRYVFKGTLQDLWNGVQSTGTQKEQLTVLPSAVNPEQFFIDIGNPDGINVQVFLKSNCQMCDAVFKVLQDPFYRDKYSFTVMVLGNDVESDSASRFVYCSEDQKTALEELLLNPNRTFNSQRCPVDTPALTTKAAMIIGVRALPMIHLPAQSLTVIGDPSEIL